QYHHEGGRISPTDIAWLERGADSRQKMARANSTSLLLELRPDDPELQVKLVRTCFNEGVEGDENVSSYAWGQSLKKVRKVDPRVHELLRNALRSGEFGRQLHAFLILMDTPNIGVGLIPDLEALA